jgi:hypothetical protein
MTRERSAPQERKPMTSYKQRIATVPPPTLEKQLEVLAAARALLGQEDEAARRRREEIAALRRGAGELQRYFPVFLRWFETERAEVRRLLKYNPDEPRVPAGQSGGGQWTKDGEPGAPENRPLLQYVAAGAFPPPPPGYDPKTWKQGQWPNGRHWLEDPDRNKYTAHPEDDGHWRHWDIQDDDGNDKGQWPPNYKKPWPTQKKKLDSDQSLSDPSGDASPWNPFTLAPTFPVDPLAVPEVPAFPRIFVPVW